MITVDNFPRAARRTTLATVVLLWRWPRRARW